MLQIAIHNRDRLVRLVDDILNLEQFLNLEQLKSGKIQL